MHSVTKASSFQESPYIFRSAGVPEDNHRYISADAVAKPRDVGRPARFQALDTLRGFAALSVTFLHLGFAVGPVCERPLHLCVDFFLVLSGFVLAHTYTYSTKEITPMQFIGHRFARLWPLQAYTGVVSFLMRWLLLNQLAYTPFMEACLLLSEIFLLNGLGLPLPADINNPPSWTVSCEFWLNLPFAYLVSKETPPIVLVAGAIAGQSLLYTFVGSLATMGGVHGLLRCGSSFMLGCAGYILHRRLRKVYDCDGFSTPVVTAMESVLCMINFCMISEHRKFASPHDFIAPWVFMVTVMCFAREQGLISKALRHLEILGAISYSIYLNHRMLLALLWPNGPNPMFPMVYNVEWTQPRGLALLWAILLPYSYLTYRVVELPCTRFIRDIVDDVVRESLGFDGQWLHRGEIAGNQFTALNGTSGGVERRGPKTVVMTYNGETTIGELREDGHLHWADGDIWIRCRQDSIVVVSL